MSLEFYQDSKKEHRWHVYGDGEDDIVHACHEGFASKQGALHNMLINHTMIGIFVASVAKGEQDVSGDGKDDGVYFAEGADGVRWKIRAGNGELVGQAHKGFDTPHDAMDNLIILYTMLSVRVAELASMRASQ